MSQRTRLNAILGAMTDAPNPAAPSEEFENLHREGQVVTPEESARIQHAINSAPESQIGEILGTIGGLLKGFLALLLVALFVAAQPVVQDVPIADPALLAHLAPMRAPQQWDGHAWGATDAAGRRSVVSPPTLSWSRGDQVVLTWCPGLALWGIDDFTGGPVELYLSVSALPPAPPARLPEPFLPDARIAKALHRETPWGDWRGAWPSWRIIFQPADWTDIPLVGRQATATVPALRGAEAMVQSTVVYGTTAVLSAAYLHGG